MRVESYLTLTALRVTFVDRFTEMNCGSPASKNTLAKRASFFFRLQELGLSLVQSPGSATSRNAVKWLDRHSRRLPMKLITL
jgi:hypothetical protein